MKTRLKKEKEELPNCFVSLNNKIWDIRNHNFKTNKDGYDICECGFILPPKIKEDLMKSKILEFDLATGEVIIPILFNRK